MASAGEKAESSLQAAARRGQPHRSFTSELPNEIRESLPMKLGARGYAVLGVPVSFLYIFTHCLCICCVLQPEVCSSKSELEPDAKVAGTSRLLPWGIHYDSLDI